MASVLGLRRLDLYLAFDRPLEEGEVASIRKGISRLAAGEPLAYIAETAPFYEREFIVTPDVLIPRPETEVLITVVREFLASQATPGTIVDVGTGSGCIGLTLKELFPAWHVVLTDISEKALTVARRNAQHLGLDVEILQGDLCVPSKDELLSASSPTPPISPRPNGRLRSSQERLLRLVR